MQDQVSDRLRGRAVVYRGDLRDEPRLSSERGVRPGLDERLRLVGEQAEEKAGARSEPLRHQRYQDADVWPGVQPCEPAVVEVGEDGVAVDDGLREDRLALEQIERIGVAGIGRAPRLEVG